jgi:hypothetical protein
LWNKKIKTSLWDQFAASLFGRLCLLQNPFMYVHLSLYSPPCCLFIRLCPRDHLYVHFSLFLRLMRSLCCLCSCPCIPRPPNHFYGAYKTTLLCVPSPLIFFCFKNWSRVPDGYMTLRQTGRMTVGRNIALTLSESASYYAEGQRELIERVQCSSHLSEEL